MEREVKPEISSEQNSVMCPKSESSGRKGELELRILGIGNIPEPRASVNSSDFIRSKDALIGVFDFLGFKRKMSYNLLDIASQYMAISEIVKSCGESCSRFEVNGKISNISPEIIQISDTFIIYALEREPQDIIQFLCNIHHILFYAILYKFPLRGALTTGEMLISKDQIMLFGPALLEAFELERSQDWSGACIGPSLKSYIDDVGIRDEIFPLVLPYNVPFKKEPKFNSDLAINWVADIANEISPDFLPNKFQPFEQGSPEENKVNNTVDFLEFALKQKMQHGPDRCPKNRKIVLEPCPDLGGRIVRFNSDDEI